MRFPSGFSVFAVSRKLNLISLRNCIPATWCCGDASRGEGTHYPGLRTEIQSSKSQPHRSVLHYRQGRLQQACTSHLTCFALSLHDTRHQVKHTHQVKHRILRILRMQVCIEHPALGKRTAHAFAHARPRLAGMSRDLVPRALSLHTTLLRAARIARHRYRRPCHLGIQQRARKPLLIADLWLSRRGYGIQLMHGLQVWAMNPRSLTCS